MSKIRSCLYVLALFFGIGSASLFSVLLPAYAISNTTSGALNTNADNVSLSATAAINGGATASVFNNPYGVAFDSVNHRLFVADTNNNRVLVFNVNAKTGIPSTKASYVFGQTSFSAADSATTQNGLSGPFALAYDSASDRLFVADANNNRVLVFDASPATLATASLGENAEYVFFQANYTSNTINSDWPYALTYDSTSKTLTVAYYQGNVYVFDASTSTLARAPLDENSKYVFNSGGRSEGMVLDTASSRLFYADGYNNRVLVFNVNAKTGIPTSTPSYVFGEPGWQGVSTQNGFHFPTGMTYDPDSGRLFVTDSGNGRIMVFAASTSTLAVASSGENAEYVFGQPSFTGDITNGNGTTTQNGFKDPVGIVYDPVTTHLFVADSQNNRILVFAASQSALATASLGENASDAMGQTDVNGNPLYTQNFVDGGPTSSSFTNPYDVAVDSVNHRLFVADSQNNRILVFHLNSTDDIVSTTASYVFGQNSFVSNGPATTQNGINIAGQGSALSYDPVSERLFVADSGNNRIVVFDASTSTLKTAPLGENAEYVFGATNYTSPGSSIGPRGVAYDPITKRLFASDDYGSQVLIFDASTSTLQGTSLGESAEYAFGTRDCGFSTIYGVAGYDLCDPTGLAYDGIAQRLFVADRTNQRILAFDVSTSTIAAATSSLLNPEYVFGQSNFSSTTYGTAENELDNPTFVSYDTNSGTLFVSDGYNNSRIMVYRASTSTLATAPLGENPETVLGQVNYTSSVCAATLDSLCTQNGLAYDPIFQHLFVADSGNNRIVEWSVVK